MLVFNLYIACLGYQRTYIGIECCIEIACTSLHSVEKSALCQLVIIRLLDDRKPFHGNASYLLLQTVERRLMEQSEFRIGMEPLYCCPAKTLLSTQNIMETEEFYQQLFIIILLVKFQKTYTSTCFFLLSRDIIIHPLVINDSFFVNTRGKNKSFKRLATAQGHVDLSRSKRQTSIYNGMFEGQPLALMNGDCPCQSQRILPE